MNKKSTTVASERGKTPFDGSNTKKLLAIGLLYLFAASAMAIHSGHTQTIQLSPDWTGVAHDFFTLSPGTANPVLTKADVTDRTNVTFVADPFMFYEGSAWYMFFEVNCNGTLFDSDIGLATSSDGFHWTYQQVVLDETFHVSYPQVFKWNGTYYMVPETYTENQVKLYKATSFPYTWTFVANIVSGSGYVDSSIFRYNNAWWLFTSAGGWSTYLYYSDNLTDPSSWHAHPMNPVISGDPSKARSGGRVTVFNGTTIIRLAQNDSVVYGQAVRAFQVDTMTSTAYAEHEIPQSPIVQASGSGWNSDGMHTVDPWWIGNRWLVAVDGVNYSPSEVWSIGIYESPIAEYQLTMSTDYGTVSPSSGQYDVGSTVSISATPPAAGQGERYVWLGWAGSGVGSYTGAANPASIIINGPINEVAQWKHEYYLDVVSQYGTVSGEGWYNSGDTAYAKVTPLIVNGSNGVRYAFKEWSGDASGITESSSPITMNAPKTATANYLTQYYIQVTSTHGEPTASSWVNAGDNFDVSVGSPADRVTQDHQWVCTGLSLDNGTYQSSTAVTLSDVQAPHTVTFAWKEQFWVVFEKAGLPGDVKVIVVIDSANYTLPFSGWFDKGAKVTFAFENHLPNGFGAEYALASSSAESPMTVNAPITVTGQYSSRFTAAMYIVILIPILLIVILVALLLKRRKNRQNK